MRTAIRRAVFAAAALLAAPVFAQAPPILPFQGYVTDADGVARDGESTIDIALYDASVDGTLLYDESQVIDIVSGFFTAELGLGDELDLALFRDNSEVWVEITIDDDTLDPRLQLSTVPYAAWAEYAGDAATVGGMSADDSSATAWGDIDDVPADLADGDDVGPTYTAGAGLSEGSGEFAVDTSVVQARVAATCAAGSSIREIAADGTVTCETDDDTDTNTTYTPGAGLALSGTEFSVDTDAVQARVAASCDAGSSIRAIAADGTVTCETDDDTDTNTTYTPGTGLVLSGTEFSVDTDAVQARVAASCDAGSSIRVIAADGTVTCETDDGDTYTAGTGIDITAGVVSVADDSIGTDQIVDDSVSEEDINLQGIAIVANDAAEVNVWSRLIAGVFVHFTQFRVMITVNGQTGGGTTIAGGGGSVRFDLSNDCQTTYGGDQTIAVNGTPGGGYPYVYVSDEFTVGAACLVAVRVQATNAANPVVVRDVQLIPTAF